MKQKQASFFLSFYKVWLYLVGRPKDFSMENRAFNAISIITLALLLILLPFNMMIHLPKMAETLFVLILLQLILYYISRFKKHFHIGIILYALVCYCTMGITYYINSGSYGPTLLMLFLSFHLLIALTRNKLHLLWMILHIIVGATWLGLEYAHPGWIKNAYHSRGERYIDLTSAYVLALIIVFVITNYLRNNYMYQKRKAEEHAAEVEAQNKKLQEIAWIQSHKVREPIANLLGLVAIINYEDFSDPENKEVLERIRESGHTLDEVIKETIDKAE